MRKGFVWLLGLVVFSNSWAGNFTPFTCLSSSKDGNSLFLRGIRFQSEYLVRAHPQVAIADASFTSASPHFFGAFTQIFGVRDEVFKELDDVTLSTGIYDRFEMGEFENTPYTVLLSQTVRKVPFSKTFSFDAYVLRNHDFQDLMTFTCSGFNVVGEALESPEVQALSTYFSRFSDCFQNFFNQRTSQLTPLSSKELTEGLLKKTKDQSAVPQLGEE